MGLLLAVAVVEPCAADGLAQTHGAARLRLVDKYGNVVIRYIGDAPTPDSAYTYTPPHVPRWQSPSLASALPCGLDVPSAFVGTTPYILWTLYGPVRDQFGHAPIGQVSPVRAPP